MEPSTPQQPLAEVAEAIQIDSHLDGAAASARSPTTCSTG